MMAIVLVVMVVVRMMAMPVCFCVLSDLRRITHLQLLMCAGARTCQIPISNLKKSFLLIQVALPSSLCEQTNLEASAEVTLPQIIP